MPRISRTLLQGPNAAAVPKLLDSIQREAKKSLPELCRELSVGIEDKGARAWERSWRNWTDLRPGKATMPKMMTLVNVVRYARAKKWLNNEMPEDISALITATEEYQNAQMVRAKLKLAKLMSDGVTDMGAAVYSMTGGFEVTVEEVLRVCADILRKHIPNWWDQDAMNSGEKFQAAFETGMHYMNKQLSAAILTAIEEDKELAEYFAFTNSYQISDADLVQLDGEKSQSRLGENWRKITGKR